MLGWLRNMERTLLRRVGPWAKQTKNKLNTHNIKLEHTKYEYLLLSFFMRCIRTPKPLPQEVVGSSTRRMSGDRHRQQSELHHHQRCRHHSGGAKAAGPSRAELPGERGLREGSQVPTTGEKANKTEATLLPLPAPTPPGKCLGCVSPSWVAGWYK